MLNRNREVNERGVAHGGVAVLWKESRCTLAEVKLGVANFENFEVLVTAGKMHRHTRKLVVVAYYLPPNYTKRRGQEALAHISDVLVVVKHKYKDPYIFLAGDFNQWDIEETLLDFADMKEVQVGLTRNGRCIDRIYSNIGRTITECGMLAPLETEDE